jgi:hypothetical protein
MAYLGTFSRTGMGIFSIVNAGFDIVSRKNKRVLSFSFFYDKGFSELVRFNIHYQYGFFNDPSKQVDVPNQLLRSRGTSFGLKIGIPIKILNKKNEYAKETNSIYRSIVTASNFQ